MKHNPIPSIRLVKKITRTKRGNRAYIDPEHVLLHAVKGSWIYRLGRWQYEVTSANLLWMKPNELHTVTPLGTGPHCKFVIHFDLQGPAENLKQLPDAVNLSGTTQRAICRLLENLFREWEEKKEGYQLVSNGYLLQMIGMFIRHCGDLCRGREVPVQAWGYVESAIRFMQNHYRDRLSLEDVSRKANVSSNYFCRVFKEHTGTSPMDYLTRVRIEASKILMLRKGINVSDAAHQVGFSSIHDFSRVFKKAEQMPPREWKRMVVSPSIIL